VFAALLLEEESGAELALREWRNGIPNNHAILFARKDSGIASIADLAGRRVAFEDPGSATSYVLPRSALESAGYHLVELPVGTATPPRDAVGYTFAQEEINVTTWVHKGRADVGALGNQDWEDAERMPPAMREDLRIIHRTAPVPRSLLLLRGDLSGPVKARLKQILLAAQDDPEGRRVLDAYRGVTRYDLLEGAAAIEVAAARQIGGAAR
jgi:phosphonate transport system substrate-binding protein